MISQPKEDDGSERNSTIVQVGDPKRRKDLLMHAVQSVAISCKLSPFLIKKVQTPTTSVGSSFTTFVCAHCNTLCLVQFLATDSFYIAEDLLGVDDLHAAMQTQYFSQTFQVDLKFSHDTPLDGLEAAETSYDRRTRAFHGVLDRITATEVTSLEQQQEKERISLRKRHRTELKRLAATLDHQVTQLLSKQTHYRRMNRSLDTIIDVCAPDAGDVLTIAQDPTMTHPTHPTQPSARGLPVVMEGGLGDLPRPSQSSGESSRPSDLMFVMEGLDSGGGPPTPGIESRRLPSVRDSDAKSGRRRGRALDVLSGMDVAMSAPIDMDGSHGGGDMGGLLTQQEIGVQIAMEMGGFGDGNAV